jgi:dihydroorotate dehydrogenase
LESIVEVVAECGIEGLIVSNTTLERPAELRGIHRDEAGGLSGPLLMAPSTALLARARRLAGGRLALVGCGGVTTGEDMLAKIQAGASLIQLYTAFAVHGPSIVARVKSELAAALRREGFATALEAVGTAVRG